MKDVLIATLLVASLAACGGGGSSGSVTPPQPTTSNPPATTYSVSYSWVGAMHTLAKSTQSTLRRMTTGAATPEPVQLAAQPSCDLSKYPQGCAYQTGGNPGILPDPMVANVYAVVSPAPSPSAVPSWVGPSGTGVQTPSPNPSATPGVLTVQSTLQSGSSTATATISAGGTQETVTPTIYTFASASLACDSSIKMGVTGQGIAFTQGVATAVNQPSSADIYIDGPACAAGFANASETDSTLHVPGGAILLSANSTDLVGITTAQWSNQFTAIDLATLADYISQSQDFLLEGKTASGTYFRIYFENAGSDGPAPGEAASALFAYDVSGYSVTGAY